MSARPVAFAVFTALGFCAMAAGETGGNLRVARQHQMPNFGASRPDFSYLHGEQSVVTCECLNWKDTYAAGKVQCGQGFEFTQIHDVPEVAHDYIQAQRYRFQEDYKSMGGLFCGDSYEKHGSNKCVRAAMTTGTMWYGQSWCYVSDSCSQLGVMEIPNAKANVKLCTQGKDELLSDMSPEELMAYGQKQGISDPGLLLKTAYQVDDSFFFKDALFNTAQLETIISSGVPTVIDDVDLNGNKTVVMGKTIWHLPAFSYEGFRCVEGCV